VGFTFSLSLLSTSTTFICGFVVLGFSLVRKCRKGGRGLQAETEHSPILHSTYSTLYGE